jgi:hypothetical protein
MKFNPWWLKQPKPAKQYTLDALRVAAAKAIAARMKARRIY